MQQIAEIETAQSQPRKNRWKITTIILSCVVAGMLLSNALTNLNAWRQTTWSNTISPPQLVVYTMIDFQRTQEALYLRTRAILIDKRLAKPLLSRLPTPADRSRTEYFRESKPGDERIYYESDAKVIDDPHLPDHGWQNLLAYAEDEGSELEKVNLSLLPSVRTIPDSEAFLFVVGELTGVSHSLYRYKPTSITPVTLIRIFERRNGNAYPYISQFSADGRYVILKAYYCTQCDAYPPEQYVLDTQSLGMKKIGEISSFTWKEDGEFQYTDLEAEKCELESIGGYAPCFKDAKLMPLITDSVYD